MSTSDTALESLDTMVYDADHAITRRSTFVDYSIIILSSFVAKTCISCAYYIAQFRQQVGIFFYTVVKSGRWHKFRNTRLP